MTPEKLEFIDACIELIISLGALAGAYALVNIVIGIPKQQDEE